MGNGLSYAWDVLGLHLNVNCWVKKICDKQIYNKLLKIHSLVGTILCSCGHKVLTRGRTGHGGVDWCLTSILAVFQLRRSVNKLYIYNSSTTNP
jgi:hypothetical protein